MFRFAAIFLLAATSLPAWAVAVPEASMSRNGVSLGQAHFLGFAQPQQLAALISPDPEAKSEALSLTWEAIIQDPPAWGTMLLGFAILGVAGRKRRQRRILGRA